MSEESRKPLPWVRLAAYVFIFAVCGAVVARELFYALGCNTTMGTIRSVGTSWVGARGGAVYFADYEYLDAQEVRHTGRANRVFPSMRAGTPIKVQYFRHAPASSRPAPSPVWVLSYGSIALLAAVVFAAEVVMWRRGKPNTGGVSGSASNEGAAARRTRTGE
jgi:hypothetical protein